MYFWSVGGNEFLRISFEIFTLFPTQSQAVALRREPPTGASHRRPYPVLGLESFRATVSNTAATGANTAEPNKTMTVHDSSYSLPLPELKVSPAPSPAGWVCPMDPSVVAADQPPEIVPVEASAMVVDDGQPPAAKGAPSIASWVCPGDGGQSSYSSNPKAASTAA